MALGQLVSLISVGLKMDYLKALYINFRVFKNGGILPREERPNTAKKLKQTRLPTIY